MNIYINCSKYIIKQKKTYMFVQHYDKGVVKSWINGRYVFCNAYFGTVAV